MSDIEFLLSLYGVLLGLSLAEVLGGLGRLVAARREVKTGRLLLSTLGVLLLVDISLFWSWLWDAREAIEVSVGAILYGAAIACLYYLAAYLAFPRAPRRGTDLERYFVETKWWILGPVLAANLLALPALLLLTRARTWGLADYVSEILYFALLIGALLARTPRWAFVCLAGASVSCLVYVLIVELMPPALWR